MEEWRGFSAKLIYNMYTYYLQKYVAGGSTRHTCPACGRKKCFTRYVNSDTGEPLSEECGKCNHENSCGYHYPPKEYFRDHPTDKPAVSIPTRKQTMPPKPHPLCTVPVEYLVRSHSRESELMRWMQQVVPDGDALTRVFEDYVEGATRDDGTIYWQVDSQMRIHSGKIMHYSTDGHRQGYVTWVHQRLKDTGQLPQEWELTQCFFGEHLIPQDQRTICLVESEKTALLCAALFPQYTWIATGGSHQLTAEKCSVLSGRRVLVFPDSGQYEHWKQIMSQTKGIRWTISDSLESEEPNTDLADLLVRESMPFAPPEEAEAPF